MARKITIKDIDVGPYHFRLKVIEHGEFIVLDKKRHYQHQNYEVQLFGKRSDGKYSNKILSVEGGH